MFEPVVIIPNLIIWIICLYIANAQGKKRTIGGGPAVALAFFLSLLGLLIVLCFPIKKEEIPTHTSADELKKWADLRASGAITEDEFNEKKKEILGQDR